MLPIMCKQKIKEFYKDLEAGPAVYFYISYKTETVDLHHSCETSWHIVEKSKTFQVGMNACFNLCKQLIHVVIFSGEQCCNIGVYW